MTVAELTLRLVADDGRRALTISEVAARAEIRPSTLRAYVTRGQAPTPDGVWQGRPVWWASTIARWLGEEE